MYEVNEKIKILVSRREANFDKACEEAYERALINFDCDDCGHMNRIKDHCRSTDSLVVEFKTYRHTGGMGGQEFLYIFDTYVTRFED